MKAKFTPGPWRLVENWRGKMAIVGPRNDGETTISDRICNLPLRGGEGVYNAALIAAAPDLYAALEIMVEAECDYMLINNLGDPEQLDRIKLSRAALARARGDQ